MFSGRTGAKVKPCSPLGKVWRWTSLTGAEAWMSPIPAATPWNCVATGATAYGPTATPVPFQVSFDPAEIDPRYTYNVRATITHEGKLLYTSTYAYPVITRGAPDCGIDIQVEPIGR